MSVRTGECRCGRVRFEIDGAPLVTMACHCRGCQRMTASAFSLSEMHAREAFRVLEGEPVIGGLHGTTRHFFCDHCKSWLFTLPEGSADFVNVRATLMDDAVAFRPYMETFTDEQLPWARTGAERSFPRFPTRQDYPALLADFDAWRSPQG